MKTRKTYFFCQLQVVAVKPKNERQYKKLFFSGFHNSYGKQRQEWNLNIQNKCGKEATGFKAAGQSLGWGEGVASAC